MEVVMVMEVTVALLVNLCGDVVNAVGRVVDNGGGGRLWRRWCVLR